MQIDSKASRALVFDSPGAAMGAITRLREAGYVVRDAYTPYAVHGMPEALGLRDTRLPRATLVGGVVGGTLALLLQIWTHTVDWPVDVGGKTNLALPALVPVTFELIVLFAGLATFATLLIRSRLRPRSSAPVEQPHVGVTDDKFVVVVAKPTAAEDIDRLGQLSRSLKPVEERDL